MHSAISQAIRSAIRQSIEEKKMQAVLWTPATLFAASEPGVWYDPSDFSTMFQDAAGTTPVTAVEQPVGLILDKSKGLVLGPELVTNGDFSNGTTGWTAAGSGAVAALSNVSGTLQVAVVSGTNSYASATIATVAGKSYRATFTIVESSKPTTRFLIGTLAGSPNLYGGTNFPTGTHTVVFTAGGAVTHLTAGLDGVVAGDTIRFDNISVRELPGNHATQTTSTSRPVLSARYNLLTKTEQFDDAVWKKNGTTVAANARVASNGTTTADKLIASAGSSTGGHFIVESCGINFSGTTMTASIEAEAGELRYLVLGAGSSDWFGWRGTTFDLVTGTKQDTRTGVSVGNTFVSSNMTNVSGGIWKCTVTVIPGSTGNSSMYVGVTDGFNSGNSYVGDGTSGIYIWGASLTPANQADLPYQRVNTATDYDADPSKFKPYLRFDGVDDWLVTPTITPGTDKAQVFAGVRKLSDAAAGMLLESSANINSNNGAFYLGAPANANPSGDYGVASRGSVFSGTNTARYAINAPDTSVVTMTADIAGDVVALRTNGVGRSSGTGDQGTGNYLAYPLYIGRRGGTTLPFNGHLYGLIVRFGANLPAGTIASTENWVAGKTGITL